ncbi:hypothetical protein A6P39_004795 [Streptomyces sp. FXJ1.172]|uniref:hypothetical protein n=1 Tax=Streptomyces sp. FXJ1.172 TaxID=710705 RepID=UPI000A54701B|nr:hypothetical protein [Streptomyces sp. FXJ1.172]WEO93394.1 hypothetical protein A6P39_004795 [Streptomyces sp. FXJ1.172]
MGRRTAAGFSPDIPAVGLFPAPERPRRMARAGAEDLAAQIPADRTDAMSSGTR